MRKCFLTSILASIAAVSLALSGCSSKIESTKDQEVIEQSDQVEDPVKIQVLITSLNDAADGPFLEGVIKKYTELNPNVEIEPIPIAMNDLYTKLLTLATSDSLPDIFTMSDAYMANAVEMEMIQDLTGLMGEEWLNGTLPVAIEGCKINNELVFMPWQNNTIAMVYRKDIFEEKGIKIPETWNEFTEVAKQLTEDVDGDGKIDRYGCVFAGTRNDSAESRFQYLCMTFGADLVQNNDGVITSDVGSDEFKAALKYYTDIAKSGYMPEGFVEIGYPEAYTMLAADQACMFFGASNVLGAIYNANPEMEGKFGSFPMPHADGEPKRTCFGTLGMSISSTTKHPDVAADFLKFLTNEENSIAWNAVSKRLPCQIEALDKIIEEDPVYKGFAESSDFAELLPSYAGTAEIRDIMGETYQSVVAENISIDDAAATAIEKTNQVIEKYK